MDIDLLSKMVKELILDNDKVVLPGLGSFVAEVVPSTFSDKGYTINPPYRKLYFRAKPDEGVALVDFYAASNNVDREIADKVIRDFVAELKSVLFVRKTVVFPGLGRMRATKENAVFFIADEDLDIYPEGFSLEPISLKTHVETREEVQTVMQELKQMVDVPESVEPAVPADQAVVTEATEPSIPEAPAAVEDDAVEVLSAAEKPVEELAAVSVEEPAEEPLVEVPVIAVPVMPESESLTPEPEQVIQESTPVLPEPVSETVPEPVKNTVSFWNTVVKIFVWLVIVASLFIAAFMLAAHFMPEFVDSILYTPEELDIINRPIC